jgi:hypothetical protein
MINNQNFQITITLSKTAYLGLKEAAKINDLTIEQLSEEVLNLSGQNYANLYKIGILTSAGLIARLTVEEFNNILEASKTNVEIANLVEKIKNAELVHLDSPTLLEALNILVDNQLLENEERVAEILLY